MIGKLSGQYGEAVQHISVKKDLRMPSDAEVAKEIVEVLTNNPKFLKEFNDSFYAYAGFGGTVTDEHLLEAL